MVRPGTKNCSSITSSTPASSRNVESKADTAIGAKLHDKHCRSCHTQMFGGDGSAIYTREDHKVRSLDALVQRVRFCATQVNANLFEEEELDIAAYLNQTYYKFK